MEPPWCSSLVSSVPEFSKRGEVSNRVIYFVCLSKKLERNAIELAEHAAPAETVNSVENEISRVTEIRSLCEIGSLETLNQKNVAKLDPTQSIFFEISVN